MMKVSDSVRMYLKNKPYLLEAMESGVVNFSALSRKIKAAIGAKSHTAVKAAVIRYAAQRNVMKRGIEDRALSVMKENRVMLLDKISVLVSNRKLSIENIAEVKIDFYYVYLTSKKVKLGKEDRYGIVKKHDGCSAIILYSGVDIEGTSGVAAFITSLLAEYNINIIELISCYTQTIIVVNGSDAVASYELISEATKQE